MKANDSSDLEEKRQRHIKLLAGLEQRYNELDEKLSELESRLPKLNDARPADDRLPNKPR